VHPPEYASRLVPGMYGPPQDCKGKFGRKDKSAQMYSSIRAAFGWRSALLAMMSCARVCPSKSVGCSFETILGTRLRTRRCDCSFVLAAPVQTSVGKFQAVMRRQVCTRCRWRARPMRYVRACSPWRLRRRSWELCDRVRPTMLRWAPCHA